MKLLKRTTEKSEADNIKMILESNGIPVFIGNEDSARIFPVMGSLNPYFVFVVHDEQHQDAQMLLKNEEHVVSNPIEMDEYNQHLSNNSPDALNIIFKNVMRIGLAFVAVIVFLVFSVK